MPPPRRRSRKVKLPLSEVSKIVVKQDGNCYFCKSEITIRNCIVEEMVSLESIKSDPLREQLRLWRARTSKEKGVPAYVVLTDKSIDGIVASRPSNEENLNGVFGIGAAKIRQYKDEILTLVSENPGGEYISEESFHAICELCDGSERISVRVPRGQIGALQEMEMSIAEGIRLGLSRVIHGGNPLLPDNNSENGLPPLEVECDVCREGSVQASAPPPNNHLHISSGGGHLCPTCGKPDWDGVFRTGGYGMKRLPNADDFYVIAKENTDFTDDQLEDIAHRNECLDVEIRGVTLEILSRIVDNYFEQSSVARVFAFGNSSSSFMYTPELVSGPLKTTTDVNSGFFWRCRFSHTTNNGSCNSCGDALKNQSHHLCYPCWKKENRG